MSNSQKIFKEISFDDDDETSDTKPQQTSTNNNNAHQKTKSLSTSSNQSNKFRPTLRLLIALVVGIIVLIVATLCVLVSNIVSTATVRDLGISLARSIVGAARIRASSYLELPVKQMSAISQAYRGGTTSAYGLPSQDLTADFTPLCEIFKMALLALDIVTPLIGIYYDDGSGMAAFPHLVRGGTDMHIVCGIRARENSTYSRTSGKYWYASNGSVVPPALVETPSFLLNHESDARSPVYYASKNPAFSLSPRIGAYPGTAYPLQDDTPSLTFPYFGALINNTGHFTGVFATSIPSEELAKFFALINTTANSHIVAVDVSNQILASTLKIAPYTTMRRPSATSPTPAGCFSTADAVVTLSPSFVCPKVADPGKPNSFPYPPLNFVAANFASQLLPAKAETLVEAKVDGINYFIVGTPVPNSAVGFTLTLLFFLPEDDIVGDIINGRNLTIGIAAAIFVIAVILTASLIFMFLSPINQILRLMTDAAQLRTDFTNKKNKGDDAADDYSNIKEIYELQKTYSDMQVAFSSFIQYTSIDMLREILDSGSLAQIGLKPVECTMLFSDIASFTSICERTDVQTLSDCLTVYFDRMTTIIHDCHSNPLAFIGDAIFAAWNTPAACANPEIKAVSCALLCARECVIDPIRATWDAAGEIVSIRQGIHCGTPNAGNVGCSTRCVYTLLGDDVNLAARLESLGKSVGCRIIVSEAISAKVSSLFTLRLLMPIAVVGKQDAVKVHEVVGIKSGIDLGAILKQISVDETLQSAMMSRHDNTMNSYATVNSQGGGAGDHRRSKQQHISKRRDGSTTAKSILQKAVALNSESVITSDYEAKFTFDFNQVANQFCDGDVEGCLRSLQHLRQQYPIFYEATNDPTSMRSAVGAQRCSALYIRPEISTRIMENRCLELQEYMLRERQVPDQSMLVFKAVEK